MQAIHMEKLEKFIDGECSDSMLKKGNKILGKVAVFQGKDAHFQASFWIQLIVTRLGLFRRSDTTVDIVVKIKAINNEMWQNEIDFIYCSL